MVCAGIVLVPFAWKPVRLGGTDVAVQVKFVPVTLEFRTTAVVVSPAQIV